MTIASNLSIGQRMAIAFTLLLVIWGTLLAFVFTRHSESGRAQIGATAAAAVAFLLLALLTTRSIRNPARELLEVARSLEEGDWTPALSIARDDPSETSPPRNEMARLRAAFGAAALSLERREQRLRANREVASAGASSLEKERVAADALHVITSYLGAEVGLIYWHDRQRALLCPVASHAVVNPTPLALGEGIPGQAALDRRVIVVRDIPADSPYAVNLGYHATPPKSAAAAPILFANQVEGVILLATLRKFDDHAISFLSAMGTQLGVALHNVRTHAALQQALDDLRAKNDRIVSQNRELQAQNEQIQAQSEEIQAQHEELSTQADQLRLNSTLLAQADQRKNEFLGVLAHELRNPLAPITTSLYLLSRAAPGSEQARRALAVLHRQVEHLTRLIDDLLDVTRISRGKVRLDRGRVDLVEVVRTTLEDRQPAFDEHGLPLEVHLPRTPVWIDGDRTRLCQVVGNLLSNAVKFTPDGQRVRVTLDADYAGGQAVVRVEDDGVGIEPDLLPVVFQPFTQGAAGLARTNGGLGLGLALVKSLVELHGGVVEAFSDGPQKGAAFVVRLPLAGAGCDEAAEPPSRTSQPWRILLVEDNVDTASSLREALELQGHSVEVAYSGREALNVAPILRPDVILCDIGLPGMDGYEVARQLRSDPRCCSILLVALTGYAGPEDKARTTRAGFNEHVAKPVSVSRLLDVLSRFENETGGRPATPKQADAPDAPA